MVFVTVNCAPTVAGALVESIQVAGRVKLRVDCKVKPAAFVGQERMSSLPLCLADKYTGTARSGRIAIKLGKLKPVEAKREPTPAMVNFWMVLLPEFAA